MTTLVPTGGRFRSRRGGRRAVSETPKPPPVDNPSPAFVYSTSADRSNPQALSGATVSGTIYIFLDNDGDTEINGVTWWMDYDDDGLLLAELPGYPEQNTYDSFVRTDNTIPYDMKGGTATALPWDTSTDPSRNNADRASFAVDGSHTIGMRCGWTDGNLGFFSVTFTVDNSAPGAVAPGAPNLASVTTPTALRARPTWTAASGSPTGYDVQWSTADTFTSPTTVAMGDVTTILLTGLTAGTRYFRVRAKNATGTGPWSNTVSAVIPASGGGIDPTTRNFPHGIGGAKAFLDYGYTEGPVINKFRTSNGPQWTSAGDWLRRNHSKTSPLTLGGEGGRVIQDALKRWSDSQRFRRDNRKEENGGYGPRGFLSVHLSLGPVKSSRGNNAVPSLQQLAQMVRGDWDAEWAQLFTALRNSTAGGYTDWDDGRISIIGCEQNAPWFPDFHGIQDFIIGDSRLTGATNGEWGPDAGPLLRQAGIDGDRGPMFLAAVRRVLSVRDQVGANGVPYVLSFASPDSGFGNQSEVAIYRNALALPEEGLYDALGVNMYVRSNNRPVYLGGDKSQFSSWEMDKWQESINVTLDLCAEYNRPFCMLEWGTTVDAPDVPPLMTNGPDEHQSGDEGLLIAWRWLFERVASTDVTFLGWYAINSTAKPPGGTYRLNYSEAVEAKFPLTSAYLASYFGYVNT